MISNNTHRTSFTLIELLIVIAVMSILLGIGSPVLFRASRIFRFENETTIVKGMMDEMRSAAINNKTVQAAAVAVPNYGECTEGYDTNFDGVCGDMVPFDYIFEMVFDENGELNLLRNYARFSEDLTYGSDDFILSEREFNNAYDVTALGVPFPFVNLGSAFSVVTDGKTLAYSFAPEYGQTAIWGYDNSNDNIDPTLHIAGITITSDDLDRDFKMIIDRTSGIPFEVDTIDF